MQNDAPSRRGDVTEPDEFDKFRRRREHQQRRWRIANEIIDSLTALALAAVAALVLKMIFF
jgi:hypothetical protein